MAKTRSMSRVAAPWSGLDHDVLLLVMMQLGVIDFVAFSGVCKSWRSLAVNNRSRFMASRPPMNIFLFDGAYKQKCCLRDGEGRKFKTILPQLAGRTYVGVTCGYIILFGEKSHDFWLVNLITRHKLHFPNVSFYVDSHPHKVRAILVYSPAPVFVITNQFNNDIWFSIAGKRAWNKVSCINCFLDLHAFKGKIYTLNTGYPTSDLGHICELTLDPESEPKLTILEIKSFPIPGLKWEFVSSGENLYVVQVISERECKILELDIGKMKLASSEKTTSEYVVFLSYLKSSAAVKPLSWGHCWSTRFANMIPPRGNVWLNLVSMWYFPHDCFNVNRLEV